MESLFNQIGPQVAAPYMTTLYNYNSTQGQGWVGALNNDEVEGKQAMREPENEAPPGCYDKHTG